MMVTTLCKHTFHQGCLKECADNGIQKCPNCRANLLTEFVGWGFAIKQNDLVIDDMYESYYGDGDYDDIYELDFSVVWSNELQMYVTGQTTDQVNRTLIYAINEVRDLRIQVEHAHALHLDHSQIRQCEHQYDSSLIKLERLREQLIPSSF